MNVKQLVNQTIVAGYSTPEIEAVRLEVVTLLENMTKAIAPAKAKGISKLDLQAQADTVIRKNLRKHLDTNFRVERDGKTAIACISAENVNRLIDGFCKAI